MSALNVWIVAPEYAPYVSYGGIGTGLRGFSRALRRRGHRVTVVIPVSERHEAREFVDDAGIRVVPIVVPGKTDDGYGTDVSEDPNAVTHVAAFVRRVVDLLIASQPRDPVDIVHVHEWPCALVPYLLRERKTNVATVLTIHNLAYQGLFPREALSLFGLGSEHASVERLELYGRISLLKGGIAAADRITTVSPTYAREIQTPERGELLDGVFRVRAKDLSGIVNGIDPVEWNPATDAALPARFDVRNLAGKRECKRVFCLEHGLPEDRPLVVSLGRLVEQKGIDWLVEACPKMIEQGAAIAIAGSGEPTLEALVKSTAQGFSGRMAALGYVSDAMARRLLAAADFLVMASRWEPCGIVQLQAMRYGAIPIARRTGGLADTIIDADEQPAIANGFLFDEPSQAGVLQASTRALGRYGSAHAEALQKRGMMAMVGWEGPVRKYEEEYRIAMSRSFEHK